MSIIIPIVAADGTQSTVTLPAPVVSTTPVPTGVSGSWTLALDEEFSGTSLNTSIWQTYVWGSATVGVNNVQTPASNVSIAGGICTLTLSDTTHGAAICSRPKNPSNTGFAIAPEYVVESRILYPGNGTHMYNWPGFWVLRDKSTTAPDITVEIDISEVNGWSTPPNASGERMNFNYIWNYPNTQQEQYFYGISAATGGYLGDAYHVYTLHRTKTALSLYLDGALMHTFATQATDPNLPQYIILNNGIGGTEHTPANMLVDYVRCWYPTGTTPNLTY